MIDKSKVYETYYNIPEIETQLDVYVLGIQMDIDNYSKIYEFKF